jgi:hypothetical protein
MIENFDGTLTISRDEVFAVAGLNRQLAELGVRATALRADPGCSSSVEEIQWADLYPRIVSQDSSPEVTIDPPAIPDDATLVLAAERVTMQRDRPARIVVRLLLVRGPAPACVGVFFKPPSPLERLTMLAREVVAHAREEAAALHHANVEAEHILLALLRRQDGVAAEALSSLGVKVERVRARVLESFGPVKALVPHPLPSGAPFTPQGMRCSSWR